MFTNSVLGIDSKIKLRVILTLVLTIFTILITKIQAYTTYLIARIDANFKYKIALHLSQVLGQYETKKTRSNRVLKQ